MLCPRNRLCVPGIASQDNLGFSDLSDLRLQSHWGSGVVFSDVDIIPVGP